MLLYNLILLNASEFKENVKKLTDELRRDENTCTPMNIQNDDDTCIPSTFTQIPKLGCSESSSVINTIKIMTKEINALYLLVNQQIPTSTEGENNLKSNELKNFLKEEMFEDQRDACLGLLFGNFDFQAIGRGYMSGIITIQEIRESFYLKTYSPAKIKRWYAMSLFYCELFKFKSKMMIFPQLYYIEFCMRYKRYSFITIYRILRFLRLINICIDLTYNLSSSLEDKDQQENHFNLLLEKIYLIISEILHILNIANKDYIIRKITKNLKWSYLLRSHPLEYVKFMSTVYFFKNNYHFNMIEDLSSLGNTSKEYDIKVFKYLHMILQLDDKLASPLKEMIEYNLRFIEGNNNLNRKIIQCINDTITMYIIFKGLTN